MIVQAESVTMGQISLGNLKAYELLFRQYYQMLCSYSLKFVGDPVVADPHAARAVDVDCRRRAAHDERLATHEQRVLTGDLKSATCRNQQQAEHDPRHRP